MTEAQPGKLMPAVHPATVLCLAGPDGHVIGRISPEWARRLEQEIRSFLAAAEPWHLYDVHVKQFSECRCGAQTNAPGPRGWKWRKITGVRYAALKKAIGWGRRSESLCPACQRRWGV